MTEIKLKGENASSGWIICIPYEINHNFFMKSHIRLKDMGVKIEGPGVVGPDWGRGWVLEGEQIESFIKSCKYYVGNIDEIISLVSLPLNIGVYDEYYIEGFVSDATNDNYVEAGKKEITKNDVLLLLSLLQKKAKDAQGKGVGLQFISD